MQWPRVPAVGAATLLAASACVKFSATGAEAADGAAPDAALDAAAEVPVIDVGAWHLVSSDGVYGVPATLRTSQPAAKGDLVVVGCVTTKEAGLTLDTPAKVVALSPQATFESASYEAEVWAGTVVDEPPGDGHFNLTISPAASVPSLDCTVDVYRGGIAPWSLLATSKLADSGPPNVTCGPVQTAPGGVAFYISIRSTCAGKPLQLFTQRQSFDGNPSGDLETDGSVAETELAPCSGSTGEWLCLTLSFSP